MSLQCSEPCGVAEDKLREDRVCTSCGAPVELIPERPSITAKALRDLWITRRASLDSINRSGVWRFRELLPAVKDIGTVITLGEGNTPVLRGLMTSQYVDVLELSIKHLGWNPTGSFKDTGMTVAITRAIARGASVVVCASTGNTAASMAAYAARAGLQARVFLPRSVAAAKVAQAEAYGAELVRVDGSFDDALSEMLRRADTSTYVLNSLNPFRIAGQKTAVIELMEQLDWVVPDVIALPGGNLGNLTACGVALDDMLSLGLIDRLPRLAVVQAEGANPFVRMWRSGAPRLSPLSNPKTIATAIRIGAPVSWRKAARALQATDGIAVDVSDDAITEARGVIGRDGIGCELGSAAALAGILALRKAKWISAEDRVACLLTGHLLKEPDTAGADAAQAAVTLSTDVGASVEHGSVSRG